jgi:hypothetical protein
MQSLIQQNFPKISQESLWEKLALIYDYLLPKLSR